MVQTLNSPLYFHFLLASYQEMTHICSECKGSDMHTFRVQAKGNQLKFDTSCQTMHISDKPDSKALSLVVVTFSSYWSHLRELEMKGFTQIEGQSTQGSDK